MKKYSSNKMIYFSFLLANLSFFNCEQSSNQGQIIILSIGEYVNIKEKDFTVGFTKILEDSRCPVGAECIWEGNGRIEIYTTKFDTDSTYFELNTTINPRIIEYSGYNIELIELDPYPDVKKVIDLPEYKCTLKIQDL